MSNKKILSVKPTKNPKKFIFETEMPADELNKFLHDKFPSTYECIESIKPSGLWKNKLFVTFAGYYGEDHKPDMLVEAINKQLEAEAKTETQVFVVKVHNAALGCENKYFVDDATALKLRNSIVKSIDDMKNDRIEFDSAMGTQVKCSAGDVISITSEKAQLWPKETEQLWTISYKSVKTNRITTLLNTKQYAENVIDTVKEYGVGTINIFNFGVTVNDTAYVHSIKVFNEKNEQVWPRETEQKKAYCEVVVAHRSRNRFVTHEDANEIISWIHKIKEWDLTLMPHPSCCTIHDQKSDVRTSVLLCDIKHIYDENGNDMLADGLAKAQKPEEKYGCVIGPDWKYPIKKSFIPKLISMLSDANVEVIDVARSHYGPISVFKTAILEIKDENNEIIWHKKPDVWHISVKTSHSISFIPDYVLDVTPVVGQLVKHALETGVDDFISFEDANHTYCKVKRNDIISIYDDSHNLYWGKKRNKKPTSFSAPSLLSRIYE